MLDDGLLLEPDGARTGMRGLTKGEREVLEIIVAEADIICEPDMMEGPTYSMGKNIIAERLKRQGRITTYFCDVCGYDHDQPTSSGRLAIVADSAARTKVRL